MKLPIVSIIGRPNTGKSSLFNAFVKSGKAIVFDKAGTTIDVNKEIVEIDGLKFILQDTGGFIDKHTKEIISSDYLSLFDNTLLKLYERIDKFVMKAVEESNLIIFTVIFNEVTYLDYELAKLLRPYKNKVLLLLTKVDSDHQIAYIDGEVYKLGFNNILTVSSKTRRNFYQLQDFIYSFLVENPSETKLIPAQEEIKLSIVGRINVGKSSIMNAILGSDRVLVDEAPGTTRDSIDEFFHYSNRLFRLIDTAGFRRSIFKAKKVEYFGIERSKKAIETSDVCVIVIDGKEGITKQDKKVIGLVIDNYKPHVICVNKWDLVVGDKINNNSERGKYEKSFRDLIERHFPVLRNSPTVFVSAKIQYNIMSILDEAINVRENSLKRIPTGYLNRTIRKIMPQVFSGENQMRLRIYYITQIGTNPPEFVVFINHEKHLKQGFENYLRKCIIEHFGFSGVPVKIEFKQKEKKNH